MSIYPIMLSLVCLFVTNLELLGQGLGDYLSENHPTTLRVEKIMNRLADATFKRVDAPKLKVVKLGHGKNQAAKYTRNPIPTITVEERVIKICDRFSVGADDALAIVIAHELAHHYRGHTSPGSFTSPLRESSEEHEGEADYFGIKYTVLAGYQSHKLFEKVLKDVYESYGLPEVIKGYPAKKKRFQINQQQLEEMSPYVHLFYAAQYLFFRKNYLRAAEIYKDLSQNFPGREVFFNEGTCYALHALSLIQGDVSFFQYPFEISPSSRLDKLRTKIVRNVEDTQSKQAIFYLNKADIAFNEVLDRDPEFISAKISQAAINILQNNPELAMGRLKTLDKAGHAQDFAFQTVKGIAAYYLTDYSMSLEVLEYAASIDPNRGAYNLELIKKLEEEDFADKLLDLLDDLLAIFRPEDQDLGSCSRLKEKGIGNFNWNVLEESKSDFYYQIPEKPLVLKAVNSSEAYGLLIELENEDRLGYRLLIAETSHEVLTKTRSGIHIGSSLASLIQSYCEPDEIIYGIGGIQYYHYENAQLIFFIEHGIVKKWATYKISV